MTTRRRNRCALLNLERLENREVPAGLVKVSISGHGLLFAASADSQVRIEAVATDDFKITGLNDTLISFRDFKGLFGNPAPEALTSELEGFHFKNDGSATITVKFTGGTDRLEYDGGTDPTRKFGDIVVTLGAGDDTVIAKNFSAKSLTINSLAATGPSSDNDTIMIAAGGTADIGMGPETAGGGITGGVTIDTKGGHDTVLLGVSAGKDVQIKMTNGDDAVTVGGGSRVGGSVIFTDSGDSKHFGQVNFNAIENARVGGQITATTQSNPLVAKIDFVTVGKGIALSGSGKGGIPSQYRVSNSVMGDGLTITDPNGPSSMNLSSLFMGGAMQVSLGSFGHDTDTIAGVSVGGKFTAFYGGGNDNLYIGNSFFHDGVSITNADGADAIGIEDTQIAKDLTYKGSVGGAGNGDSFISIVVGGEFTYTGGTGADVVTLSSSRVGGKASFTMFEGANSVTIRNTLVHNALSVLGGKNADTVDLSGVLIFQSASIQTGAGNDSVTIDGPSEVKGLATIDTGTQDDAITIACQANEEINFLGGLNVKTGFGADNFPIGMTGGKIWVLNGYTDDFDTTKDTGDIGNLLIEV